MRDRDGGGIIRDAIIGDTPVAALKDQLYIPVAVLAGLATFVLHQPAGQIPGWLLTGLDAAGLGLFCAAGAFKALDYGLPPVSSAFLGTLTAVGGGVIRDVLVNRIPAVLRIDVYAVAALLGATVMLAGGAACFVLRVLAAWQHWQLPKIP